jgi:molybdate-binding protein/DNA-binding transcriptional regulator YhcF (GntR family)
MHIELADTDGPIYTQIVAQVTAARDRGELVPGERLPGVRELAAQLGVNRNTIAHAYRLLRQAGVIVGHAGQGSRIAVADTAAVPREPPYLQRLDDAVGAALAGGIAPPLIAELVHQGIQRRQRSSSPDALVQCQGSHDFCLDLLARRLRTVAPRTRLICTPVGSTAGLLALGRGEAQLAGLHLLDTTTGEYNWPSVRRLLPGLNIRLITLVEREQGLIVRRGNPLGVHDITDLARPALRYASRQPGSGTQLLLEHLLAQRGLTSAHIEHIIGPLTTHLAVAAAVAGGRADVALGVRAAARALDLDFIPLTTERYDLAFREEEDNSAWLAALLETLASPALRADIEMLDGYDASHTAWMAYPSCIIKEEGRN